MKLPSLAQIGMISFLATLVASEDDLYKILGVERTATDKEISKAFRKLAQKYHPDHNKDPNAEDKFIEIARAYEILGDSDKRREYDAIGFGNSRQSFPGNDDWHSHAHFNMRDFFADFDPFADFNDDFFGFQNAFHRSFHQDAIRNHAQAHAQAHARAQAFAHEHAQNTGPFGFGSLFGSHPNTAAHTTMHTFTSGSSSNGNCRTSTVKQGNTVFTQTVCG